MAKSKKTLDLGAFKKTLRKVVGKPKVDCT